jgi:hypothetical protein
LAFGWFGDTNDCSFDKNNQKYSLFKPINIGFEINAADAHFE